MLFLYTNLHIGLISVRHIQIKHINKTLPRQLNFTTVTKAIIVLIN